MNQCGIADQKKCLQFFDAETPLDDIAEKFGVLAPLLPMFYCLAYRLVEDPTQIIQTMPQIIATKDSFFQKHGFAPNLLQLMTLVTKQKFDGSQASRKRRRLVLYT